MAGKRAYHAPMRRALAGWLAMALLLAPGGGGLVRAQEPEASPSVQPADEPAAPETPDVPAAPEITEDPAAPPAAIEPPPTPPSTPPSSSLAPPLDPIAVLLIPAAGVEPDMADALNELLIAAVAARGPTRIVGKEEFQAQLGQGDASTAECLESITCLGRVGVALGVHEVVAGTIGHHGETWAFALSRIDVRTGATRGRVFREVTGDLAAVVRSLPQSIDDLYEEVVAPGRLVVRASVEGAEVWLDGALVGTIEGGEPVRRDLLAPGRHDVLVSAHGHASFRRTIDIASDTTFALEAELVVLPHHSFEVPALTWVLGGVAFAALAAGIGLGVSSSGDPPSEATMRAVHEYFATRATEAIAADVCFAVAAASGIGALVPLVLAALEEPADEAPAISLAPLSGGALLTWSGAF